MLLKKTRASLPRAERASWLTVTLALFAVLIGLFGNILHDPLNVQVFVAYLTLTASAVAVMFLRIEILKLGLFVSRAIVEKVQAANVWVSSRISQKIEQYNGLAVIYFSRGIVWRC
jgi:hypothetical protein